MGRENEQSHFDRKKRRHAAEAGFTIALQRLDAIENGLTKQEELPLDDIPDPLVLGAQQMMQQSAKKTALYGLFEVIRNSGSQKAAELIEKNYRQKS